MRKLIVLIAAAACMAAPVRGQRLEVEVSTRLMTDNSLAFFADITGYGTHTIELVFDKVENATVPTKMLFTATGSGQFFVLRPNNAAKPARAEFHWNWLQGKLDPPVQKNFVYRLPFNAGVSTTPKRLSNHDVGMMRENFRDFAMWQFPLPKDGTIFAARAGQVITIEGFYEPTPAVEPSDADRANSIYVEHADGTIAVYSILDSGSLMVAAGDSVYPDTPLAKAGQAAPDEYVLRFQLYYYATNRSEIHTNMFSQRVFLNPLFSTEFGNIRLDRESTVTAQVDKKLIGAEKPRRSLIKRLFRKR